MIQCTPIGAVGAEVDGIDLNMISDEDLENLKALFAENSLLFFRDQELSPEAHLDFAKKWGPINVNRFFTPVEGYPSIAEVRKEPHQQYNIGGNWHTDHSYDQIPALGSMLYAKELPKVGGDTLFAGCAAAFDTLSEGMKSTLRSLRAVHSSRHVFGKSAAIPDDMADLFGNADKALQDAEHPVVIKHPLSVRETLYVNPGFTTRFGGWTEKESNSLLAFLYEHISRPEHTYRFQWSKGALAFWDNRATWHLAVNDYPGETRLMHRITIEGEPLEP